MFIKVPSVIEFCVRETVKFNRKVETEQGHHGPLAFATRRKRKNSDARASRRGHGRNPFRPRGNSRNRESPPCHECAPHRAARTYRVRKCDAPPCRPRFL